MIKGRYLAVLISLITITAGLTLTAPVFAQGEDAKCLATAIMSEASVGSNAERVALAWTIFNRVSSPEFPNTICEVVNQPSQYATNQAPTQEVSDLAESLIANPGTDPTGGATYFFSPRSMPKEGDDPTGYDTGGGLHDVDRGLTRRSTSLAGLRRKNMLERYQAFVRHITCSIENQLMQRPCRQRLLESQIQELQV